MEFTRNKGQFIRLGLILMLLSIPGFLTACGGGGGGGGAGTGAGGGGSLGIATVEQVGDPALHDPRIVGSWRHTTFVQTLSFDDFMDIKENGVMTFSDNPPLLWRTEGRVIYYAEDVEKPWRIFWGDYEIGSNGQSLLFTSSDGSQTKFWQRRN